MVHFFGIFAPEFKGRRLATEAPHKVSFFGGASDVAPGAVSLSRAEQDACYLNGKFWEPEPAAETAARPAAARMRSAH
jgi:hypothetical protein